MASLQQLLLASSAFSDACYQELKREHEEILLQRRRLDLMLNWTFCFSGIEMVQRLILAVNPFFLGFLRSVYWISCSTDPDSRAD